MKNNPIKGKVTHGSTQVIRNAQPASSKGKKTVHSGADLRSGKGK